MLSGLQLSAITLLVMHLKQQRAKRNEVVRVKIYRKQHLMCIFVVISDISIVKKNQ